MLLSTEGSGSMATETAKKRPRLSGGKLRRKRAHPSHEREMGVLDHLGELRARLFRVIILIGLATTFVWFYFDPLYTFFTAPIREYMKEGDQIIVTNWLEPFFLQLKLSLYGGLVVSAPFWIMEVWGFIAPALTPEERKPIRLLAPMTVVLFLMGVMLAHFTLPMAFRWSLGYLPPNVQLMQRAGEYVELLAKLYLAFGICFELPIVLMFLAKVGIIDAQLMRRFWRHAIVGIMGVAALITPSNDPITMTICAVPMGFLYLLSIYLVEWMNKPPKEVSAGEASGAA